MYEFDDATFDGEFPFDDDDEYSASPCNHCDECCDPIEAQLCAIYQRWLLL